ncbi:MAG: glycosyltransferase [Chitinophagaceae bacterium]|nr:MAG: glycosyltransferase [Chitinophagaceae bacterium]
MRISVIIPAYNEEKNITDLVQMLLRQSGNGVDQVMVVDGHSNDGSLQVARKAGAQVLISPQKGRAAQMNYGALKATGDMLYFVHADVRIHPDFAQDIKYAVSRGYDLGCYRFVFDSKKLLLKINSWFTRLPFLWCRGGDQTLFVKKEVFNALSGFRADYQIMEDYDFIERAQKDYRFAIIPKNVVVSARKYQTNSYLRVQHANYTIMRMWKQGASQEDMVAKYKQMINYR